MERLHRIGNSKEPLHECYSKEVLFLKRGLEGWASSLAVEMEWWEVRQKEEEEGDVEQSARFWPSPLWPEPWAGGWCTADPQNGPLAPAVPSPCPSRSRETMSTWRFSAGGGLRQQQLRGITSVFSGDRASLPTQSGIHLCQGLGKSLFP